jgi:hypothetical protein
VNGLKRQSYEALGDNTMHLGRQNLKIFSGKMLTCHFNNKTFKAWAFKTGLITEIYTIIQFSLQQKHVMR